MKKNDKKILDLKKIVDLKKQELDKMKKTYRNLTNCMITIFGMKYNINVLTKDELYLLLEHLKAIYSGLNNKEFKISSFNITSWISDIEHKITTFEIKGKEEELEKMEIKLNDLLSEDTRTNIELEALEAALAD